MELRDSKTFGNLQTAYEYELESSSKYQIYSAKADAEILMQVSDEFDTIARNGRFIARRLRNIINGQEFTTLDNLIDATKTEENAEVNLYRQYSRVALEEGFTDIASLFNGIANIKLNHSLVFESSANSLERNEMFCKDTENLWICLGCGNIMSGLCAPTICPVCGVPQGYYELLSFYRNRHSVV